MNRIGFLRRAAISFALGTVAPLVFAQASPGGGMGGHGNHANNPQMQACRKQADDQNLARGEARKSFMQNCMKNAQSGGNDKSSG